VRTLFCPGILAAALLAVACHRAPPPLPVLGNVPAFVLTDETGKRFDSAAQLAGQVWIANFIFTRCPDICPAFTAKMAIVQERTARLAPAAPHLVSFSVDPTHDTPEVLAAYAGQHGARAERWSFLTGAFAQVRAAVEDSLKVHMEQNGTAASGLPNISHGSHFVLIDASMRIRGYYDMNDADAVERIVRDAAAVEREVKAAAR
jgi:protein SCO1/2